MPTETLSPSEEILLVRHVSGDIDRSYIARCPHCCQVIGLEDDDLDDVRCGQYQNKRCGGWLEVSDTAAFVRELPEAKQ